MWQTCWGKTLEREKSFDPIDLEERFKMRHYSPIMVLTRPKKDLTEKLRYEKLGMQGQPSVTKVTLDPVQEFES